MGISIAMERVLMKERGIAVRVIKFIREKSIVLK